MYNDKVCARNSTKSEIATFSCYCGGGAADDSGHSYIHNRGAYSISKFLILLMEMVAVELARAVVLMVVKVVLVWSEEDGVAGVGAWVVVVRCNS